MSGVGRVLVQGRRTRALPLAVLGAAVVVGAPSAAIPGIPSIYVDYNPDCTFSMSVDGGITLSPSTTPGATLPPGTYQLLLSMPNPSTGYACVTPSFSLTGPGVNIVTVFPAQAIAADDLAVLQPSSTYVAEDTNLPGATERVFATAASGSSTSLLPAATTTPAGATDSTQSDLVGSAVTPVTPYRGVLHATVGAQGKATLTLAGRSVSSLDAGRYEFSVVAEARAGFFVERAGTPPLTVAAPSFVGRRTEQLTLKAGTWSFFTDSGKQTRFTVLARPAVAGPEPANT